jgi:lysylphosphatidylglycerol synthetase-like protein (DUF2156 family)
MRAMTSRTTGTKRPRHASYGAMKPGHRLDTEGVVGPAIRSALTVGLLAATTLSVQAWLATHGRHSAAAIAVAALAPIVLMLVLLPMGGMALAVLMRPKETVREALLVVAVSDTLLALWTGRPALAVASALALSLVVLGRRLWSELSDARATQSGRKLLAAAAAVLVVVVAIDHPRGFLKTIAVLGILAVLMAAAWGLLLLVRNAPLPVGSGSTFDAYRVYAAAGVSPFALTHDKRYFWNREGTAFLAYATRAGVAVVLGPGVGPAEALPGLYQEFRAAGHRRGWRLAFYQVSGKMADGLGWGKRYRIGNEAIVDLTTLTLSGPTMAKVRHEVSRATRQGVTARVVPSTTLTAEMRAAMEELATAWTSRRALGEMAFSVGRHADPPAVPTTVVLGHDAAGRLVAYTTWYQLPGSGGLVLDEFRRLPGAPGGTMQLLLYTAMMDARSASRWASLGLAPAGGPGADSLRAFKMKFRPALEPRYMVVERLRDWPEAALATLLIHYPELAELPKRITSRRRTTGRALT